MASHLLKWAEYQVDRQGGAVELRYFREIDGREVDFVRTDNRRPIALVETKCNDEPATPSMRHLKQRLPDVPAWRISARGTRDHLDRDDIRIAPAGALLKDLV